jgi:hypothetical protein
VKSSPYALNVPEAETTKNELAPQVVSGHLSGLTYSAKALPKAGDILLGCKFTQPLHLKT